jgi:hypothetical protein
VSNKNVQCARPTLQLTDSTDCSSANNGIPANLPAIE